MSAFSLTPKQALCLVCFAGLLIAAPSSYVAAYYDIIPDGLGILGVFVCLGLALALGRWSREVFPD